jgi:hypothetical protein
MPISELPSPSGRPLKGQRDIGDLLSPFFRVKFTNVEKENVKKQKPSAGDVKAKKSEEINEKIADILVKNGDFEQGAQVSGRPLGEDDNKTLEINSKLFPKIASNLKIESKAGSPLKFTLSLTPPYDDGIRLLNSRLLNFGTLVTVQWGYTSSSSGEDILSDVFVFRNHMPRVQFGQDISITLEGFDLTASVGARNVHHKKWNFHEYKSDFLIVKEIVNGTSTKLDVTDVPKDSNFRTGKNRKPPEIPDKNRKPPEIPDIILDALAPTPVFGPLVPTPGIQQTTNDWAFIRRILNDHGLSCTAQGNKFRIFSLFDASTTRGASYRFLWRQKPKGKRDIPVYNIRGNLQPYLFLPAAGSGILGYTFDKDADPAKGGSKVVHKSPTNKETPSLAPGMSGVANTTANAGIIEDPKDNIIYKVDPDPTNLVGVIPHPKQEKNTNGTTLVGIPDRAHNSNEKIDKLAHDCQAFSHPKVGLNAPGVVDMWPGISVLLKGTSDLFDGPYYVLNATHTIGNSGYDMEIVLLRHTVKGYGDNKPIAPPRYVEAVEKNDESDNPVAESSESPKTQIRP